MKRYLMTGLMCLSASACSGGGGGGGGGGATVAANGDNQGDKDDLTVTEAVPMALIGGEYLASVEDKMSSSITSGSYSDTAKAPRDDMTENDTANHIYPQAEDILAAPGRATGEMKTLIVAVREVLVGMFGKSGTFGARPVDVQLGPKKRLFQFKDGNGKAAYAQVSILKDDDYKYGVDVYTQQSTQAWQLTTKVRFTPGDGKSLDGTMSAVKVAINHAVMSTDPVERIDIVYDTATGIIAATSGYESIVPGIPAKSVFELRLDTEKKTTTVVGAYVWQTDASAGALTPRYYSPLNGDIEVFAMRSRDTAQGLATQRLAYLKSDEVAAVGSTLTQKVFDDYGYPRLMSAFLTKIVRMPELNTSCSTSGDAFRSAFSSGTPASVQNAPSNICNTQTTPTDAYVTGMINDTCDAGINILLPVLTAVGANTTRNYNICKKHDENTLLADPQLFYVSNNERNLVQDNSEKVADHDKLTQELKAEAMLDISELKTLTWSALTQKALSEFDGAETVP